ncbi:sirohydrochlorin chelatase [Chloroflexota bacterium]
MQIVRWLIISILGLLVGIFLIIYLTVSPIQMSFYLLITLLAIFLLVALLSRFRGRYLILAGILSFLSFGIGYYLMTSIVLDREDTREIPQITRGKNEPGNDRTAVVYFTHGEPETYDPVGWLNQFREFDEQGIPFVPLFARPMFIYQLRNAYLKVGQSHHRQMHIQMVKALDKAFIEDGYSGIDVYLSFLDDKPRPDAAVIKALNDGASKIIAAEVFVTISNHTAEGEELINSVNTQDYGVSLKFTGPLWDSETLHRMFLEKTNSAIGDTDKLKVGVILVGHGQPDEWDDEFPTETEQELLFREQILDLLAADGYDPDNLGLAWMSFKDPKPAEKVEELLSNGVEKIVFFSAAISADSIHSQYDIPELIHEAEIPEGFQVINLGAWNDHPLAIQAIKDLVISQME